MEYGSIVGHGAYLGPDYTDDHLRRATDFVESELRNAGAADRVRR
jgi:nitric oxide reductase subunit B